MDHAERVRELVAEVLAAMETEGPSALESACERHPDLAGPLRRRVEALGRFGLATGEPDPGPGTLGDYRLIAKLGGGGMGVVYLAEELSLQRQVALKLIRPDQLPFEQSRARFHREALATSRLNHPNIIPVYGVGEHDGVPYLAMEYVAGRSLGQVLDAVRDRPLSGLSGADLLDTEKGDPAARESPVLAHLDWVEACVTLVREVAVALEHAHRRGVIHRDVKPSNILVAQDGSSRVVDFGLADASGTDELTRSGTLLGSLPYLAPEVVRGGAEHADAASDVYSLGVTLYELLTLRAPYLDNDSEITRQKILAARAARPRTLNGDVSWDVETVCLTAMEQDRGHRYPSAAAFAEDLRRVLERRPILARPPGLWRRGRRFVERNPGWALSIGMTALLMLVVAGFSSFLAYRNYQHLQTERGLSHDLRESLDRESNALASAEANWQRSQRSLAKAREAVRRFLTLVADDKLEGYPETEELRRDLLADAARFSEEFRAIGGDLPEDRRGLAHNFTLLGQRQVNLGALEEARRAYVNAIELLGPLAADSADGRAVQEGLAIAWYELGAAEAYDRQFDHAIDAFQQALVLAEALREVGLPGATQLLAMIQSALASPLEHRGRYDESLDVVNRSLALFEEQGARIGEDPTLAVRHAMLLTNRLRYLAPLGQVEECVRSGTPLLTSLAALREGQPRELSLQQMEAIVHGSLADAFEALEDWERAEEHALAAMEVNRSLSERFPQQWFHTAQISSEKARLAELYLKADWPEDALSMAREAVADAADARARYPGVAEVERLARNSRSTLAYVLHATGGADEELRALGHALAAEYVAAGDLTREWSLAHGYIFRGLELAEMTPAEDESGLEWLRRSREVALPWFEDRRHVDVQKWRPEITRRLLVLAFELNDPPTYEAVLASLDTITLDEELRAALEELGNAHATRASTEEWSRLGRQMVEAIDGPGS